MILQIIIILWAIYDIWALYFISNELFIKNRYLFDDFNQPKYKENWKPFFRTDRRKWNYLEIYLCTIFLSFWRFSVFILVGIFL